MNRTFIAWTRYNRRSDLLAEHFGATMTICATGKTAICFRPHSAT